MIIPDSKVHGANMGPTWVLSAPDGPHVGPMSLAIRDHYKLCVMKGTFAKGQPRTNKTHPRPQSTRNDVNYRKQDEFVIMPEATSRKAVLISETKMAQ